MQGEYLLLAQLLQTQSLSLLSQEGELQKCQNNLFQCFQNENLKLFFEFKRQRLVHDMKIGNNSKEQFQIMYHPYEKFILQFSTRKIKVNS